MVRLTYVGLGLVEAAVREFDALRPHVLVIRDMQAKCWPLGPDDMALQIAVDGLETAAYHFTRRRMYYEATKAEREHGRNYYEGLGERPEAWKAFDALAPYMADLRRLQGKCRPFGRDYLALDIAKQSLETAAYHFTQQAGFYGSKHDSSGPARPLNSWEVR
jgi:hypothetical protein